MGRIEDLYKENKAHLLAYGTKILGHRDKAEDALQETFLAIIKNKEKYLCLSYKDLTKLSIVIFRNKCIDQLRRKEYKEIQNIENKEYILEFEASPLEEWLIRKEESKNLKNALNQMDTVSRKLLELKYVYGLSYKEIAKETSLSIKHVETKLYRVRKKLRKILGEETR